VLQAGDGGRPCLLTPEQVDEVSADVCLDTLPRLSACIDERGRSWNCFELPSTSRSGVPGPVEEIIHIQFFSRDGRRRWGSVSVAGTLPRPKTEPREYEIEDNEPETTESAGSDDAEGSRWLLAGEKVEELIGRHFDLINSLYDQPVADGWRWEGDVQGMAVRPLGRVLERWGAIGDTGEPRLSLIVSLARELPPILEVLCEHPRHVLGRVRTMQPLDRVQELDGMCLRWLARQPGRRVIEKAGVSQRVLGIARVEVVDTLENRVLRDLMRRAMLACRRYQAEYGHIDHERVRLVREFRHQLRRLLHHSAVAGVRALPGVPRPNYVLQQDSRYRIIWAAYLRLVRQETMLDDAWRWRQRIWVEDCGLAITTVLAELSRPGLARSGDVLLHSEQVAGRFLDPRAVMAGWNYAAPPGSGRVDLLDGRPEAGQLDEHPLVPEGLAALRPDFVAIWMDSHPRGARRVAALWTLLDFDLVEDYLGRRAESIATGLRRLPDASLVRGLLLQPELDGEAAHPVRLTGGIRVDTCRGLRMRLPLQGELDRLRGQLQWALTS